MQQMSSPDRAVFILSGFRSQKLVSEWLNILLPPIGGNKDIYIYAPSLVSGIRWGSGVGSLVDLDPGTLGTYYEPGGICCCGSTAQT